MDFWGLLFIAVFQFLTSAVAAWDSLSPLILVNHPQSAAKVFPYVVKRPEPNKCPVYDNYEENNTATTFVYCPNPSKIIKYRKCNSVSHAFTVNNIRRRQHGHNIQKCESEVEYHEMKVTTDDGAEVCMHNGNTGRRYKFVYLLCDASEIEEVQIYEICYQEDQKEIILGHFTIENPRLLRNLSLRDEQEHSFGFDTQPTYTYFLEKIEQIYHQAQLTAQCHGSRRHRCYLPRSVVPHELFAYGQQRKACFNYMNAAPMDSLVLTGWELVMTRLRDRLSRMDNSIHVTAGLFHLPRDDVNVKYMVSINDKWMIKVPDMWWTLLYNHDRTKGVAIIMHDVMLKYMPFDDGSNCNPQVCQEANISDSLDIFHITPYVVVNCCYPQYMIDKFNLDNSPIQTSEILKFP